MALFDRTDLRSKLVQNDLDRTQSLFDATAYLADVLARYASIEQHYRSVDTDDWPQLRECIISVYVAILRYAFEVRQAWKYSKRSMFDTMLSICASLETCE